MKACAPFGGQHTAELLPTQVIIPILSRGPSLSLRPQPLTQMPIITIDTEEQRDSGYSLGTTDMEDWNQRSWTGDLGTRAERWPTRPTDKKISWIKLLWTRLVDLLWNRAWVMIAYLGMLVVLSEEKVAPYLYPTLLGSLDWATV